MRDVTRPIVSVVAPAGYGKTTLLVQWAERSGQAVAWVSLDEQDNDSKVLLGDVARAQDAVRPVARPAFDAMVNVVGSLNVLEGARQAEAERVVFAASGGTLYGEPAAEDLPVRESHPQQPLSPYLSLIHI